MKIISRTLRRLAENYVHTSKSNSLIEGRDDVTKISLDDDHDCDMIADRSIGAVIEIDIVSSSTVNEEMAFLQV